MASPSDNMTDLEKLAATLPQPPSPSAPQQGLSFSVAGVGLGPGDGGGGGGWNPLADSTLSLDFGDLEPSPAPIDPRISEISGIPPPSSSSPSSSGGDPENGEERGQLLIHYVGGSITFLLQIAVVAWGVRQLRRVLARRRQMLRDGHAKGVSEARMNSLPFRPVDPPLYTGISATAVRKLAELYSVPFLIVDVRHPDAARDAPFAVEYVINIPESELRACLQLIESAWDSRFPAAKQPARTSILVFVSTRGQRAERAATVAAELGFNGCCVLSGGIQSYTSDAGGSSVNLLGRDAVAFLLDEAEHSGIKPLLIDVRRYDERSLYGHIPGSLHIPVEEWPKGLAMSASDWENNHHFPKIEKNDVVILYSRTWKRAMWVAQLCSDAGITRCYVYKQGAFGWRLDPTVLPYDCYEQGDAPPEPLSFEVETCNRDAAEIELRQKGFIVTIQTPATGDEEKEEENQEIKA